MLRCVVKHPPGIDGVAFGATGDFPDNAAVLALCDAGLLVPERAAAVDAAVREAVEWPGLVRVVVDEGALARQGAQFDASWKTREAEHARELAARDARITELEVEVAQLRIDLEAATAPAKPATEG